MSDKMTAAQRFKCMSHNRANNTRPEIVLRGRLWQKGFRYRLNVHKLPGSPDIVLPKYRTAIFVHGCFWHGHKNCKYYTIPKTNPEFWKAKVARNQERDQEVWRQLEAKGWFVIIVWECQLKKANLDETVARVAAEIVQNGESYRVVCEERRKAREEYRRERKARKGREQALLEEAKSI